MSKPKVAVLVMCGSERSQWLNPALTMRLLELPLSGLHISVAPIYATQPVDVARNKACEHGLCQGADWTLMIDNDQVPPPHFVERVIADVGERKDVDIVSLPTYSDPAAPHLNVGFEHPGSGGYIFPTQLAPGWTEVQTAGAGVIFVRRRVLETLPLPWFRLSADSMAQHVPAGEDLSFVAGARKAGFRVWTNTALLCGHLHTADLSQIAATVEQNCQQYEAALRERYGRAGVHAPTPCELQREALEQLTEAPLYAEAVPMSK